MTMPMMSPFRDRCLCGIALMLGLAVAPAMADEALERLWDMANLYEDENNSVVQYLHITGRAHGQYHWSEGGESDDDAWEMRRFRLGLEAGMFSDFIVKAEVQSAPDFDPVYNGLSDLSIHWRPSRAFGVTVGKHVARFTYDYGTSSKHHPAFERNLLLNQFRPDRAPGVTFYGDLGKVRYFTGVFTNTPGSVVGDEFTHFDGGGTFIASLGYDLHESWHLDGAEARLDYHHSEHNAASVIYNRFDDGVAASLALRQGRATLVAETICGLGGESGDAAGLYVMPGWYVSEKLLLVARYQIFASDHEDGLDAQRRYERAAGLERGDLYQAVYAGFNYFIHGDKLKLMGGIEYATMNGRDAWTGLLGVRMFWDGEKDTLFAAGRRPF